MCRWLSDSDGGEQRVKGMSKRTYVVLHDSDWAARRDLTLQCGARRTDPHLAPLARGPSSPSIKTDKDVFHV